MSSSSAASLETNATSDSVYMSSSAPPACSPAKLVLNLAPGFHFLPTDAELVIHYLRPMLANANHRLPLPIFVHERILKYHPDELIEKYRKYGDGRWFFVTVRERKQPGGNRPNRTTPDDGHWNATGSIKPIRRSGGVLVGYRRTLVFYEASRRKKNSQQAGLPATEEEEGGQAAKAKDGVKTDWTMYEYESLSSEAEFEAIRNGNAHKMDVLVLCTIQKKKHGQEGKEGDHKTKKKSTKRKTKEEEGLEAAPATGDVEQGTSTTEGQDEDDVQRTLMEEAAAAAAAEPQPELAHHDAPAGVGNFNVDPNHQNMPYYHLINSLSPVPTPLQDMVMASGSRGDNHNVMLQQNYNCFINQSMNMNNSQPFHAQAALPQEFLPYSDTKMAASRGGSNTMDHMLQDRFVSMTPSQAPPVLGPGTYLSPWHSKLDMPLKSEDAWRSSHCQAKLLSGRELNSPYVTNSLSLVPTPQQETMMALLAARGYNHTAMNQRNYFNHSMNMRNSQFHHVQETLTQEEFHPYSSKQMAVPLEGGNVVDHHMLQNRIVDMTPAAEGHAFNGYGPGLYNSSYGHGDGDYDHLSTIIDHPEPSRFSFPLQQFQGPLLNNQVSLNHQNPAASMVEYDQRNGVGLEPKIV